jgi:hypothetical protein
VRRRWFGVIAVLAAAVAVAAAVALSQRGQASPGTPKPVQARPSQQYGDTADLMRRLERKKLLQRSP